AVLSCEGAALAKISNRLRYEVRVAAGTVAEERDQLFRQLASGRGRRQRPRVSLSQRLQLQLGEQPSEAPARTIDEVPGRAIRIAAMDEQKPHRRVLGGRKELIEQGERGLVGPVEVLQHKAQGRLLAEHAHEPRKRVPG